MEEYIILTDDTMSLVMEKTRWPLSECVQLITKGHRMGGTFSVFYFDNKWQRVFIYHRYNVRQFMYKLKRALYDAEGVAS